jgi:starch synthase
MTARGSTRSDGTLDVVHVTSELVPYSKTGGLADAVAGLTSALPRVGVRPRIVTPRYGASTGLEELRPSGLSVDVAAGDDVFDVAVYEDPGASVPTLLLDVPELYGRDGVYGEGGIDYPDNFLRYAVLSRAALEVLTAMDLPCDVLHVHDWQTALVPLYLKSRYAGDGNLGDCRSVLTIHNLAYQGRFWHFDMPLTGLSWDYFAPRFLEFHGEINLLKGGIVAADAITTVSATYAREILLPENGHGLDGVLADRRSHLFGIRNGIDAESWDPATDPSIASAFDRSDLAGKGRCKRALVRETRLEADASTPVFGVVSRLAAQKGIDLVVGAIAGLVAAGARFVVLGSGDPGLERALRRLAKHHPGRVATRIGYDEAFARRIYAGTDFFLVPSRFEPCGLSQMYAQRYGSVPIVRATGGLAETVRDLDDDPESGSGFTFTDTSADALTAACRRALSVFRRRGVWPRLRRRIMAIDSSWLEPAGAYRDLYRRTLATDRAPIPPGP